MIALQVNDGLAFLQALDKRFLQRPIVAVPSGVAMAMGGEKAATVLPEPGPDAIAVGLRQIGNGGQRVAGKN